MSLKQRLFGPPWENKDPDVRARSIASSTEPGLFAKLPEIAVEDPAAAVRIAALRRLGDESAWLKARDNETDPDVVAAADQYLLRAVCERPSSELTEQRLAWLARIGQPDALRRVASAAADAELRQAALERITSQGFLGDCVISETDDRIATAVLARIDQVSTLKRIAGELRKRHKARHQAVITRLAELEHDTDNHEARDELARQLIQQAEKLARGETAGDRKAEAERLERQWKELSEPDPALARRFDGAMRIVTSALQPRPERAAKKPAEADAPTADPELERLAEQASKMASEPAGEKTAAALNQLISTFDRHWNSIRSPGEADHAVRSRFGALTGELQARLQAQQQQSSHSAPAGAQKDNLQGNDNGNEKGGDEHADERGGGDDRALHDELEAALDAAERALASGDIADSDAAIRTARSVHDRLPRRTRPKQAAGRLARMAGKLKEIRDWQHWSNNKLRERLIERVDEIDAASMHPDAVTERLKELRQRWKELDQLEVLPGDKRRFAAPQGQWRRFQRACKEAFDAARPYLEKRSEVREENLHELNDFLADARAVVADEQTDADKLIRYQRAAREAIRNLDTLPPKHRGESAAALRELMDSISAALDEHFDAIEAEKRRLVAEARKLAHEKDRGAAIDRAKALQAEWKKAGRGRRKTEEKLWREFREPIDPLFEDLKKQRDERKQAEHEHAEALKDLCARAEALAGSEEPERAAGQISGLEDEFGQYASIPPALRKRFERAIADFRKELESARQRREQARRQHLVTLAGQLQAAWQALLEGKSPDSGQDGDQNSDQGPPEPVPGDELAQRLFERLTRLTDQGGNPERMREQIEKSTRQARQVVVEMECLSGVETPEEDRQLRMDYQISRLSNRLGDGAPRPDLDSERADLEQRWFDSFPHDPELHGTLQKRYENADKILQRMTAN